MNHPYTQFENTSLWKVIEKSVKALEANGDLTFQTPRGHVVGYLCQELAKSGTLVDGPATSKPPSI